MPQDPDLLIQQVQAQLSEAKEVVCELEMQLQAAMALKLKREQALNNVEAIAIAIKQYPYGKLRLAQQLDWLAQTHHSITIGHFFADDDTYITRTIHVEADSICLTVEDAERNEGSLFQNLMLVMKNAKLLDRNHLMLSTIRRKKSLEGARVSEAFHRSGYIGINSTDGKEQTIWREHRAGEKIRLNLAKSLIN
ncbi:hypothetical protein I2I05_04320 [Hymenobacter sp. BT683]|uniref:Uncharacterized protein n=1 Tax=Hymenobacter jeongseonensis TaxID=2791027 RepID=A0ABS0IEZ1_9BACT|nr:hypothetical protein [Hymenobacter jeongseonensis]MBF9236614.1 hypothetical protein [Hymenobacter jeongseonensis]